VNKLRVVAIDVGSVRPIRKPKFAWVSADLSGADSPATYRGGSDPAGATAAVADALKANEWVALGLESPLVIPIPKAWEDLGKRRDHEGARAWSAGAGVAAMGTGLVQLAWICSEVKRACGPVGTTAQPDNWSEAKPLLLWEAFVSSESKKDRSHAGHAADAKLAADLFKTRWIANGVAPDVHVGVHRPFNLAVAAAMHAGLNVHPDELSLPILVLRAE
jgi:hypothetical protein